MKILFVAFILAGAGLGSPSRISAADTPQPAGEKPKTLLVASAIPSEDSQTSAAARPLLNSSTTNGVLSSAVLDEAAAKQLSAVHTNSAEVSGIPSTLAADDFSDAVTVLKNENLSIRPKYGGLFYDLFKFPDTYHLFENDAVARYASLDDNTTHDMLTGRPNGVCLFRIRFGRK